MTRLSGLSACWCIAFHGQEIAGYAIQRRFTLVKDDDRIVASLRITLW
ncbi:hypothetical protein [Xenorhabdus japonica]|nr:hypothetical protein [Xenorhabdus japonica]